MQEYRLPHGGFTTDSVVYAKAWAEIQDATGAILGLEPYGYDPCISFHSGMPQHPLTHLSIETCERLIKSSIRLTPIGGEGTWTDILADKIMDILMSFREEKWPDIQAAIYSTKILMLAQKAIDKEREK